MPDYPRLKDENRTAGKLDGRLLTIPEDTLLDETLELLLDYGAVLIKDEHGETAGYIDADTVMDGQVTGFCSFIPPLTAHLSRHHVRFPHRDWQPAFRSCQRKTDVCPRFQEVFD